MEYERRKKSRPVKLQYVLWWMDGNVRREFGPVFSKSFVKKNAAFYRNRLGQDRAGWEVVGSSKSFRGDDGERRSRRERW